MPGREKPRVVTQREREREGERESERERDREREIRDGRLPGVRSCRPARAGPAPQRKWRQMSSSDQLRRGDGVR